MTLFGEDEPDFAVDSGKRLADKLINQTIRRALAGITLACFCLSALPSIAQEAALSPGTGPRHAIAMHGEPALAPGFRKFPFAYDGPTKGGTLSLSQNQTFDSVNPFIIKGNAYWAVRSLTFESLMARNSDEPFSLYGLLAESIETPQDRSWVEFTLRAGARFSNGSPVSVDDVIYSMETLREHGQPNLRSFYSKIIRVDRSGPRKVRFVFEEGDDREAPLLMGLMPILSKAFYATHEFNETTFTPPVGSGPYRISRVDPGKSVTFTKVSDYWGEQLSVNKGRNNFETIKLEYYRDENTKFEAFKKGLLTLRVETDPARWVGAYDFPATRNALIVRDEFRHGRSSGMLGLVFNSRRALFADPAIREALGLTFDFDWMNRNYFHGAYARTKSFFDNSTLAATGPASEAERALLGEHIADVAPDILEAGWQPASNKSNAEKRANALKAFAVLKQAGWKITDGQLRHGKTGEPFTFEILLGNRVHERVAMKYARSLKVMGITATVRVVDSAQFQQRLQTYDFDMAPFHWRGTLSPGNEQGFRWGSREADLEGTYNFAGVKSEGVDKMVRHIAAAETRAELTTATRALDRLLLSGHYVIPLYHQKTDRIAWWSELQHPRRAPGMGWGYGGGGFRYSTWWMAGDN